MGDVVKYLVRFEGTSESIWIEREVLKKYRPRGYIRHLEDCEKTDSHSVETILAREIRDKVPYYYIKFWKYPSSDNAWVKASTVEDWTRKELEINAGHIKFGQAIWSKPTIHVTPNISLLEKNSSPQ